MIGPTGVGKTEIARRLAKLAQAPFIKVEASKYTEVGYVGRDVESMIRDLTELAVTMVKAEMAAAVRERAECLAEERLLDLLLPRRPGEPFVSGTLEEVSPDASRDATRDKLRAQLRAGKLDERSIEMDVQAQAGPMLEVFPGQGMEEIGINLKDMLSNLMPDAHPAAAGQGRGGAAAPGPGGGPEAGRRRRGGGPGDPAGRGLRDRLPRRAGQGRGPRGRHGGPTCRGRACSGTSCRSWRARR